MFNGNITLKGKFTFNVYQADGTLRYSGEMPNYITPTGLSFPSVFAFADCFRFVSIGTGTYPNILTGNGGKGTTGLHRALTGYSYIGSRINSTSQYENPSCGFRENNNVVSLSRGWRIPAGDTFFDQDYNLTEFMVSPGRPYEYGSFNKVCSYNDGPNDLGNYGKDQATVADFYQSPRLCDAPQAFARVLKNITVNQDDFMVITYDLNLTYATGIQSVSIAIDNHVGGTNWTGTLLAKSNLVHHGIKLISDGDSEHYSYSTREQIPSYQGYTSEYGEAFIAPLGCPLEPSLNTSVSAYISTDNVQFAVNRAIGGRLDGSKTPASFGLMDWHATPTTEATTGSFPSYFSNVRQDGTSSYYPLNTSYSGDNVSADSMSFEVTSVKPSRMSHTPMRSDIAFLSRIRTGEYSFQFWSNTPDKIAFLGKPIRSIVLGYYDPSDTSANTIFPFYDIILSDRNNRFLHGNQSTHTYDLPNESTDPPTGYFYLANGGQLTLSFNMTWGSDCDPSVCGCSGSSC